MPRQVEVVLDGLECHGTAPPRLSKERCRLENPQAGWSWAG